MKRILFITAFVPSNIGAGVNYTRQLLDDISRDCKVDLMYFKNKSEPDFHCDNRNISVINIFNTSRLTKLLSVMLTPVFFPLFTAKFSLKKLFKIRKQLRLQQYDYVYLDFSQMFLYGKFLKNCNIIYMAHDIIGQRYERRNYFAGKWAKLSEKWIMRGSGQIFTFSKKDSILVEKWYGIKSLTTSFYFGENVQQAAPENIEDYFVFFAMWQRADNYKGLEWFISNVLDEVCDKNFKIIGMGLPIEIKGKLHRYTNVEYLGFVENPYPIIANSKALISPLFQGAGVKVKVLDAMAVGTPVIGTDISFEGIDDINSPLMNRANTACEFIEKIRKIDVAIEYRKDLKKKFLERNNNKEIIKYIFSK